MFQTLVASGPQSHPRPPRLLLSVALHGLVVAGAIAVTRQNQPALVVSRVGTPIPFVVPAQPRSNPPASHRATGAPLPNPAWTPDLTAPKLSPPMPAVTIPGVTDLLKNLASASGAKPKAAGPGVDVPPGGDGDVWTATSVDDPVAVIEQPAVRYPAALAHAGISGRVELEYVVDTLGRAEPESIRAVVSTRPEFEAAARETVLASRYRPARLRGRLVRQLVRQTLSFRAAP